MRYILALCAIPGGKEPALEVGELSRHWRSGYRHIAIGIDAFRVLMI